jgi:type I restriction enzyme S subunit
MLTYPNSWLTKELGQVAILQGGGTPSRKNDPYFSGDIPWLTGYDLPENQVTSVSIGREYITETAIAESSTTRVPAQTVLLTTRVTVGKVAIAQVPLCYSQDLTGIIIKDHTVLDPYFLAYYLLSLKEQILRLNRGTTIVGVIRSDIARLQIPLPPLPEQHRIVDILHDANELRRLRHQANNRAKELAPALFSEMFGNPIENPLGWEIVNLTKLGELDRGRSRHRPRDAAHLYGGSYPFIQTGDVANSNGWISEYTQTYSEAGLAQSKLWPSGTLCITIAANIAKTGILQFDACFPDSVVGFRPHSDTVVEYIQQWFGFIQEHLELSASQAIQRNINLKVLRNLDIPKPPLTLQLEYKKAIRDIRLILNESVEAQSHIDDLFQSLLTSAFTGDLTDTWRKAHNEELSMAVIQRDLALKIQLEDIRSIETFPTELGTQTEVEALEQMLEKNILPVAQQLVASLNFPNLGQLLQVGAFASLTRQLQPLLNNYRNQVNNGIFQSIKLLNNDIQATLAAAIAPIEAARRALEQATVPLTAIQEQLATMDIAAHMAYAAALQTKYLEYHPRYALLHNLSRTQRYLYLAAAAQQDYFTDESLASQLEPVSEVENEPSTFTGRELVQQNLKLLVANGLVVAVSVRDQAIEDRWRFVPAYRSLKERDDSRMADLAILEERPDDDNLHNLTTIEESVS